ncbi:hypothetical protein HGRIS_005501 [Hohenbuehelia grisea]|uniref:TNT domain-containing protein n=1 Tax=Hohenbuehelia grisea TaxID=104357 RepID=A0ABR3JYU5_9AGAR
MYRADFVKKDALAARAPEPACGRPGSAKYCAGTNRTSDDRYVCGDSRLGPARLPRKRPIGNLVFDYDRFDGLCPGPFLKKWTDATGAYVFPPESGFQLNTASAPIAGNQSLPIGLRLDRFGSEFGRFLAPAWTPYEQRSLPPSSLDTPDNDPSFEFNYHQYEVTKEFVVLSGPIAPWFGQPGQGTQYQAFTNVMTLISGGFLRALNASEF